MDITPQITTDAQVIQGYGPGFFRVSHRLWTQPLLVAPALTLAWDKPGTDAGSLEPLATHPLPGTDNPVEVILLGMGDSQQFVPPSVRHVVTRHGVTLEFMATGAACRTYNVLLAEGRGVLAALLPLSGPVPASVLSNQGAARPD